MMLFGRMLSRSLYRAQGVRHHSGVHIKGLGQTLPYVWLRDACPCPECIHPSTRQKLFRTSDIALDTHGVESISRDGLQMHWQDGHESLYPWDLIVRYSNAQARAEGNKDMPREAWTRDSIYGKPDLFVDYPELATQHGLKRAIDHACRFGLLFIRNVPSEGLRTVAEYFGHLRVTFYGDVWDVKNVANSRNIAYTNLDLGLHMDLLYMQHPPQLQLLHCLRNRVFGGESIFSDGLHAAETLWMEDPAAFQVLTSVQVPFHYINDGHHLHQTHPTIEVSHTGAIRQINYSPPFQAPLLIDTPAAFYPALRKFAGLVAKDAYEYLLKEGDVVLFDNRRVLHARKAFADIPGEDIEEGDSNRWLKGCYIEADEMWDKGRMSVPAMTASSVLTSLR